MIPFRVFALLVFVVGCREIAGDQPQRSLGTAAVAVLGLTLGCGLLFKARGLGLLVAGGDVRLFRLQKLLEDSRRKLEWLWVAVVPAALLATGWGQWLNLAERSGCPQSVALLGWFLPSILLIMLVEMTAAQFDAIVAEQVSAAHDGVEAKNGSGTSVSWPELWALRVRMGDMASFLTCIMPVLLISAIADCLGWLPERFADQTAGVTLASTVLALAFCAFFLPSWLGAWMGVTTLEHEPLGERVEQLSNSIGLPGRVSPHLVRSRGRWVGAAVVGWLPGYRQLWLGDGLIAKLNERQLDMVLLHELAHICRWHSLVRMAPLAAAILAVAIVHFLWPTSVDELRGAASGLAASLVLLIGVGAVSRRCELDADRQACNLAAGSCTWADGETLLAARTLAQTLLVLTDSPASRRATWMHPSLAQRLANLQS